MCALTWDLRFFTGSWWVDLDLFHSFWFRLVNVRTAPAKIPFLSKASGKSPVRQAQRLHLMKFFIVHAAHVNVRTPFTFTFQRFEARLTFFPNTHIFIRTNNFSLRSCFPNPFFFVHFNCVFKLCSIVLLLISKSGFPWCVFWMVFLAFR